MNECEWAEDADGNWATACGECFFLTDGTPLDNGMAFCCYCGARLLTRALEPETTP